MHPKMKEALARALEEIEKLPIDELYRSFHGYTKEEYEAYGKEQFEAELEHIKLYFENGTYAFEPKYNGEPEAHVSKLFWNYINEHNSFEYSEDSDWPTTVQELKEYGLRVVHISGQGTISIFEEFDFFDPKYLAANHMRQKRRAMENHLRKIEELMEDKPREFAEVQFTTVIGGEKVVDNGLVEKVYTKKGVVRYLIDSMNHGKVIVFFESEKYPNDSVIEI